MSSSAPASATLSSGKAVIVDREALNLIATPPRTTTFTPVPHGQLVDLIETRLGHHNMKIEKAEFAVQNNGLRLYGVMVLKHQTRPDFGFAIGIKTSNDKSLAAQLIAGARVFVCENGVFSGEPITWRKHTSSLEFELRTEINDGVDRAVRRFGLLETRVKELEATKLTVIEAKAMIVDAAMKGVMPKTLILDVVNTFLNPPHPEFNPSTMWSLHNAFTEVFRSLRPNLAMDNAIELGRMFQL